MPIAEKTGYRDLTYSKLHRTWDKDLNATDLDWIEYSINKKNEVILCGVIETKKRQHFADALYDYDGERFQRNVYLQVGNALRLPVFLVSHNGGYNFKPDESPISYIEINEKSIEWFSIKCLNEIAKDFMAKNAFNEDTCYNVDEYKNFIKTLHKIV